MKIGMRTPSPKRSIKARTTGRVKRSVKSSIDPTYGKKSAGYFKDPKRAVYNNIYHKVSVDPLDPLKHPSTPDEPPAAPVPPERPPRGGCIALIFAILSIFFMIWFAIEVITALMRNEGSIHLPYLYLSILLALIVFIIGKIQRK